MLNKANWTTISALSYHQKKLLDEHMDEVIEEDKQVRIMEQTNRLRLATPAIQKLSALTGLTPAKVLMYYMKKKVCGGKLCFCGIGS